MKREVVISEAYIGAEQNYFRHVQADHSISRGHAILVSVGTGVFRLLIGILLVGIFAYTLYWFGWI